MSSQVAPTPTPTRQRLRRHRAHWRTSSAQQTGVLEGDVFSSVVPSQTPSELIPRAVVTMSPVPTKPPNVVVFQLNTLITVNHFSDYYGIPPESFTSPHYRTLADGSLVADPLIRDMSGSRVSLFVIGLAFCFFLGNTVTSLGYIIGGKIKHKILLYMLFASQLLASATYISLFAGYLNDLVDCTVLILVSQVCIALSQGILISGILGMKAYRCLNNSRYVLGALVVGAAAHVAIAVADMTRLKGVRRLAGSCIRNDKQTIAPFLYVIECANAIFVCCCFIYAIRKSARLPASRGRLSLHYSPADGPRQSVAVDPIRKMSVGASSARGWWDLPEDILPSLTADDSQSPQNEKTAEKDGMSYPGLTSPAVPAMSRNTPRKSSLRGEFPLPQPSRPSRKSLAVDVSDLPLDGRRAPAASSNPSTPSSSLLNKFMPRVSVFREAMRDELKYTAVVCAICCLSAILAAVGVMGAYFVGSTGWEALNWFVVSRMIMHSFRRVIRRHEEEAIILKATNWDPTFRRPRRMSSIGHIRGVSKTWSVGGGAPAYRRPHKLSAPTTDGSDRDPFDDGSMYSTSPNSNRDFDTRSWRTRNSSTLHLIAEARSEISGPTRSNSPPRWGSSPLPSPLFPNDPWKSADSSVSRRTSEAISPTAPSFVPSSSSAWSGSSPRVDRGPSPPPPVPPLPQPERKRASMDTYLNHPLEPDASNRLP